MQTGVLHPRAARQPAVQPAQQDLGVGLLTEAFLYEEQTRRGVSLKHFDELTDVADHCTVCHKLREPCPVKIDFGDVSVAMRNFLRKAGKKNSTRHCRRHGLPQREGPATIKAMRAGMMGLGYKAQRAGHQLFKRLGLIQEQTSQPPSTVGKPAVKSQVIHFFNKPMPGNLPKTSRALLDIEDPDIVPVIRDPQKPAKAPKRCFTSRLRLGRLFSQVGLATQAMLYHAGVQTVLPPGYLCCGFPQNATGNADKGQAITTENRVLFHRVANTLNYLDIKTVIVSCGTCMDQLPKIRLWPDLPLAAGFWTSTNT